MTLTETDRIDIIARSPSGEILLVIVSVGNWSEDDRMVGLLETKLDNYAAFAQSQTYRDQCGAGQPKIELATTHELTAAAEEVVRGFSERSGLHVDVKLADVPPLYGEGIGRQRRPGVRER